jgi:hypothetical protein
MKRGTIKSILPPENMSINGFAHFVVQRDDGSQILVPVRMSLLAEVAEFEVEHGTFAPIVGREVVIEEGKILEFL